jgi:hypothetical protein
MPSAVEVIPAAFTQPMSRDARKVLEAVWRWLIPSSRWAAFGGTNPQVAIDALVEVFDTLNYEDAVIDYNGWALARFLDNAKTKEICKKETPEALIAIFQLQPLFNGDWDKKVEKNSAADATKFRTNPVVVENYAWFMERKFVLSDFSQNEAKQLIQICRMSRDAIKTGLAKCKDDVHNISYLHRILIDETAKTALYRAAEDAWAIRGIEALKKLSDLPPPAAEPTDPDRKERLDIELAMLDND